MPSSSKRSLLRAGSESTSTDDRDSGVHVPDPSREESPELSIRDAANALLAEHVHIVVIDYSRSRNGRQLVDGVYVVPQDIPDAMEFNTLVNAWPEERADQLYPVEDLEPQMQVLVEEIAAAIWNLTFADISRQGKKALFTRRSVFFCCKTLDLVAEEAVLQDLEFSSLGD